MSTHLNPLSLPLSGTHLIEASAGTGKTWNIAALYTRLVVLEHMSVDKILVVTFTKAATAELKTRLRARLDEALLALQNTPNALLLPKSLRGHCSDGFLFRLLIKALQKKCQLLSAKYAEQTLPNPAVLAEQAQTRLQLRLKAAISDFDHAAIFTIHGFCQRVLQDFAFYCQVPFQIELDETVQPEYRLIAAQDFWRKNIVHDAPSAHLVYQENWTPQKQLAQLDTFLSRPYLTFRQPEKSTDDLATLQNTFYLAWQKLHKQLAEIEQAFWQLRPQLSGTYYKDPTLHKKFHALQHLSAQPTAQEVFAAINSNSSKEGNYNPFNAATMEAKKLKNATLQPELVAKVAQFDETYAAAYAVMQAEQDAKIALQQQFITYLRQTHEMRKKEQPERRFDDLLLDVFHALQQNAHHAQALAAAMSAQWHTALIDEFQDTDPLQYEIFRHTFGEVASREQGKALFLVGDPKQAIYSFRGADIFAYLNAANDAPHEQRYSLDTNHRSHAKLINSISALFARDNPFALPEINYPPVKASRTSSRLQPERAAVLVRWLNENHEHDDHETSDNLAQRAADWCAQEIRSLLNGQQHIQNHNGTLRPLEAKEIAVLVRARKDGACVQRQLKHYGIQSVLLSQDSIFAEDEAKALFALLSLMLQPQETGLLSFVLAGCLFDYNDVALTTFMQDEQALFTWNQALSEAMQVWQKFGIYAALQSLLARYQVEARLLAANRDRTLTNLHQLLELLANQSQESQNPTALQQWLGTQIQAAQAGKGANNTALLRLESDENLVKIVTMHASKGLQYPIVFCPFAYKASQDSSKDEWQIIHRNNKIELVHKNQLDEQDSEQNQRENLSEDLRLLYVALTRAEEQLVLYMAQYNKTEQTPYAYLLNWHKPNKKNKDAQNLNFQSAWQQFIDQQNPNNTDFKLEHGLSLPVLPHSGSLKTTTQPIYHATIIPKRRFELSTHTSFTGLAYQTSRTIEAERAELSPTLDSAEQIHPPHQPNNNLSGSLKDINNFTAGIQAGICLHEILEHFRAQQPETQQREHITQTLKKYGFNAEEWCDTVWQMANNTVQTPLSTKLNIAMLPEHARLDEMGFLLHSEDFSLTKLKQWFQQKHLELPSEIIQAAQHLSFHDVHGYISGFIDLFAFTDTKQAIVVDYKSNVLGNKTTDYTQNAMNAAMAQHHYYLQALIYAIACARYLNQRKQKVEHISVRYLFLRGLDGLSNNGVWAWDIAWQDLSTWLE